MIMLISDADDKYLVISISPGKAFVFRAFFSCTLFKVAIGNPAVKRMYFLKLAKRLERKSSSGIIEFLAADLVTLSPDLTLLQTNHILGDQPVCKRDAMKMKSFPTV